MENECLHAMRMACSFGVRGVIVDEAGVARMVKRMAGIVKGCKRGACDDCFWPEIIPLDRARW